MAINIYLIPADSELLKRAEAHTRDFSDLTESEIVSYMDEGNTDVVRYESYAEFEKSFNRGGTDETNNYLRVFDAGEPIVKPEEFSIREEETEEENTSDSYNPQSPKEVGMSIEV